MSFLKQTIIDSTIYEILCAERAGLHDTVQIDLQHSFSRVMAPLQETVKLFIKIEEQRSSFTKSEVKTNFVIN